MGTTTSRDSGSRFRATGNPGAGADGGGLLEAEGGVEREGRAGTSDRDGSGNRMGRRCHVPGRSIIRGRQERSRILGRPNRGRDDPHRPRGGLGSLEAAAGAGRERHAPRRTRPEVAARAELRGHGMRHGAAPDLDGDRRGLRRYREAQKEDGCDSSHHGSVHGLFIGTHPKNPSHTRVLPNERFRKGIQEYTLPLVGERSRPAPGGGTMKTSGSKVLLPLTLLILAPAFS